MSACLIAREVVISIRENRRGPTRQYTVICPASWEKSAFLEYVRSEHPDDGVRIIEWREPYGDGSWLPKAWLVNPQGFSDFVRGEREVSYA